MYFATTLTADTIAIGLSALVVAFVIRAYTDRKFITPRTGIIFFILMLWLALSKQPYWLIGLSALPLAWQYRSSKYRKYLIVAAAGALLVVVAAVGWTSLAQTTFSPYRTDIKILPSEQIKQIFLHPVHFTMAFVRTYITGLSDNIMREVIGRYGLAYLPAWISYAGTLLLMFTLFLKERDADWNPKMWLKAWFIGVAFLTLTAISVLMYASWSAVRAGYIDGVQGRYFIPLLFLLAGATIGIQLIQPTKKIGIRTVVAISCLLLVSALFSHIEYNYHILMAMFR